MKKYRVLANSYRDSVTLMQLSARINRLEGVELASALMATPANIQMMIDADLLDGPVAGAAPNDLILVVRGQAGKLDEALAGFERLLAAPEQAPAGAGAAERPCTALVQALRAQPETSVVLISVPGEYAASEALKALRLGRNVMLFSDNVPVEREVALKEYATAQGLLVMGPDCGTAIIAGAPLAFANVVRQGPIGVVGASGTGTQEVTSLIDQLGLGITHAIGTGGHDLSAAVGGLTMLAGLRMLAEDSGTRVIVLVSKPPAAEVAGRILELAASLGKPVVVCFLGARAGSVAGPNLTQAGTLEEAAHRAVALAQGRDPEFVSARAGDPQIRTRAAGLRGLLRPGQRFLRALYSGGTFCYEAQLGLRDLLPGLASNTPTGQVLRLADARVSQGHTVIDLGDDEFTRGRPHPMIDGTQRCARILHEAADPETAVILLDVVLGYGAGPDPAGELASAVREARRMARAEGREIVFISFVCGTAQDPQDLRAQRGKLTDAEVVLCASNAEALALAGAVMVV